MTKTILKLVNILKLFINIKYSYIFYIIDCTVYYLQV